MCENFYYLKHTIETSINLPPNFALPAKNKRLIPETEAGLNFLWTGVRVPAISTQIVACWARYSTEGPCLGTLEEGVPSISREWKGVLRKPGWCQKGTLERRQGIWSLPRPLSPLLPSRILRLLRNRKALGGFYGGRYIKAPAPQLHQPVHNDNDRWTQEWTWENVDKVGNIAGLT